MMIVVDMTSASDMTTVFNMTTASGMTTARVVTTIYEGIGRRSRHGGWWYGYETWNILPAMRLFAFGGDDFVEEVMHCFERYTTAMLAQHEHLSCDAQGDFFRCL